MWIVPLHWVVLSFKVIILLAGMYRLSKIGHVIDNLLLLLKKLAYIPTMSICRLRLWKVFLKYGLNGLKRTKWTRKWKDYMQIHLEWVVIVKNGNWGNFWVKVTGWLKKEKKSISELSLRELKILHFRVLV